MLIISGKALGHRRPLFADFSVPPPDELGHGGRTTVRDLIECVVRHEVAEFKNRQEQKQFIRALTQREIADAVETGKVESGGTDVEPQPVDANEAVGTALQAFEDGMFLLVVDGRDHRNLDDPVFLQTDSQLTFVRLTLLAGG